MTWCVSGRSSLQCKRLFSDAENSSRPPSDSWNTLEPHWNLWQKPLFSLAFETHVLFLGLGHLLFRLIVKHFVLRASWRDPKYWVFGARSLTQDRLLAWQGQKGEGNGGGEKLEGEKWNIKRGIYIDFILQGARKLPSGINGYWTIYWNSFTIPKSFERSAKRIQVLVHFLSTCS